MKQFFYTFLLSLGLGAQAHAQTVSFENVLTGGNNVYNGSDNAGGFTSGPLYFRNSYDAQFQSWSGFGASAQIDTSNGTFSNQYSCFAGEAKSGSTFGIAYYFGRVFFRNPNPGTPLKLNGLSYTNSTWAAKVMRNGDAFSKKFGGQSGNDPDYFALKVFNHYNGQVTDTAILYLADYRFADNSQDYIVKAWREATFNFSQPFDSIGFELESTDVGAFGMNTPAYFCVDDIVVSVVNGTAPAKNREALSISPNPARNRVLVQGLSPAENWTLTDALGQILANGKTDGQSLTLNLEAWNPGIYFLQTSGRKAQRLVISR